MPEQEGEVVVFCKAMCRSNPRELFHSVIAIMLYRTWKENSTPIYSIKWIRMNRISYGHYGQWEDVQEAEID